MTGERGGNTASLEDGVRLIETHKGFISRVIRDDILDWLSTNGTWHRDDLRVHVPAESKNAIGAAVISLVRQGRIVETGERRKSSDPASHGRKSNVYRVSSKLRAAPRLESPIGEKQHDRGAVNTSRLSAPAGGTGQKHNVHRATGESSGGNQPRLFELPARYEDWVA